MSTKEPDWKALCVAYVKADAECIRLAMDMKASNNDYGAAADKRDEARSAMRAAVKAHGDA